MLNNVQNHEDLDFDYSEVTTNIQLTCLKILAEIHRVCVQNDIRYSLGAGTVIGLKLFEGFIPWDDDIDLLFVREEYEKFLRVFPQQCDPRYELVCFRNSENVNTLFAKVCDRQTTVVENPNGRYIKNGAYIDISVLDGVPNKSFHKKAMNMGKLAYALMYRQSENAAKEEWKNTVLKLLANDFLYKRRHRIYRKFEDFCMSHGGKEYSKYAELMVKNFWSSLYDVDLFDDYIKVYFENVETYVIKDYDRFLIQKYNKSNFVRNQPREKRAHAHSVYFTNEIGFEDFDIEEFIKSRNNQ